MTRYELARLVSEIKNGQWEPKETHAQIIFVQL